VAQASVKRPFWMHQFVEYIIGGAVVAMGIQGSTPAMPMLAGLLIVANAAVTKGPFGAFRAIDRRVHRMIDPVLVAFTVFAALQPWVRVENNTKITMIFASVVHLFVWWQSSFEEKPKRSAAASTSADSNATPGSRSEDVGRMAGRLVGSGVKKWRNRPQR
jgi:hypothetical protein